MWGKMLEDDFGKNKVPQIAAFNILGRNYTAFTSVEQL